MVEKEKYVYFTERFYRYGITEQAFENLVQDIAGINNTTKFEHISKSENISANTIVTFIEQERHLNENIEGKIKAVFKKIQNEIPRIQKLKEDFERYIKV